jgi:hypothetical protein
MYLGKKPVKYGFDCNMARYSRLRVSNENAYPEALFRTFKYRPGYPYPGFATLEKARDWVLEFGNGITMSTSTAA